MRSLFKAFDILESFSLSAPKLSLGEISQKTGLPKSTVHRLMSTLLKRGYLVQDASSKRYQLSLKFLNFATVVLSQLDFVERAKPFMEELSNRCKETVHIAVMDQGEMVYVGKVEQPRALRISSRIGGRIPIHCTALGKVMLANMPEEEVEQIIQQKGLKRFTGNTITDKERLKRELEQIRRQGYAIDREEYMDGLMCVAYPIRDYSDKVIGALSISGAATDFKAQRIERWIPLLKETSRKISENLGFKN